MRYSVLPCKISWRVSAMHVVASASFYKGSQLVCLKIDQYLVAQTYKP